MKSIETTTRPYLFQEVIQTAKLLLQGIICHALHTKIKKVMICASYINHLSIRTVWKHRYKYPISVLSQKCLLMKKLLEVPVIQGAWFRTILNPRPFDKSTRRSENLTNTSLPLLGDVVVNKLWSNLDIFLTARSFQWANE